MRKIHQKQPKPPRPLTEARKDKQAATVARRKAKYDALRNGSPYREAE